MSTTNRIVIGCAALIALCGRSASAQSAAPVTGRVAVHVNSATVTPADGARVGSTEVVTSATLESVEAEGGGVEFGLDVRHAKLVSDVQREDRLSVYNAFAGLRVGDATQLRVRAGHLWLSDLGTTGAIAGGLLEVARGRSGRRLRVGAFGGLEPVVYEAGYAPDVRKVGGYAAVESGTLRRHVVGYTRITQGALTERSVLAVTNYVPAGPVFAYQAAEFEVDGPAQGTAAAGLSYFFANVRATASSRVELMGTYNRGRSLDARRLTHDLLNGRALTPQALEGLQYESGGGRVTVEVAPGVRVYGGYTRDRTNRDDITTGRILLGGHAGNVGNSGFDLSASMTRVERAIGPYHSEYISVGRNIGRTVYVSGDYSTSLSLIRFLRSDGVVIETRPSTKRVSGSASAMLTRAVSLLVTADYTLDDDARELRVLSGLSYRFR